MFIAAITSLNEQHKESPKVVLMGLFGKIGPSFARDFTCTVRNKGARLWQLKRGQSLICDLKYFLGSPKEGLRHWQPSTSALKSLALPLLLQQLHKFHSFTYMYLFCLIPGFPIYFLQIIEQPTNPDY